MSPPAQVDSVYLWTFYLTRIFWPMKIFFFRLYYFSMRPVLFLRIRINNDHISLLLWIWCEAPEWERNRCKGVERGAFTDMPVIYDVHLTNLWRARIILTTDSELAHLILSKTCFYLWSKNFVNQCCCHIGIVTWKHIIPLKIFVLRIATLS